MNVICFLNEKGGTGKTTTSVTLATLLAQVGYRVLLIDADSQGHATLAVRLPREDRLYHLIKNNAPFKEVLVPVAPDYIDVVATHPPLWVIPSAEGTALLDDKTIDPYTLHLRLTELAGAFDLIVIDTSPKIGHLHLMAYLAANHLIYPVEMAYLPIQGLFSSFLHLANIQNERDSIGQPLYRVGRVMGILPTKYRGRLKIQQQNLAKLKSKYFDALFFSPLKFLAAWDEASQLRRPINRLGYDHEAAPEAELFAREVIERMGITENAQEA